MPKQLNTKLFFSIRWRECRGSSLQVSDSPRKLPSGAWLVIVLPLLILPATSVPAWDEKKVPPPVIKLVGDETSASLGTFETNKAVFEHTFTLESQNGTDAPEVQVETAIISTPPDAIVGIELSDSGTQAQGDAATAVPPAAVAPEPAGAAATAAGNTAAPTRTDVPTTSADAAANTATNVAPSSQPAVTASKSKQEFRLSMPGKSKHGIRFKATLSRPGSYRFALTVVGNQRQSYHFLVKREPPAVSIVGVEKAGLVLSTDRRDFNRLLVVKNGSDVAAEDVKVSFPLLTGPAGQTVKPLIQDQASAHTWPRIKGNSTETFNVSAVLAESGEYQGVIELTYLGGRQSYAIKVTKSLVPATLTATSQGAAFKTLPMVGSTSIVVHVTVRETGGRAHSMDRPSFEGGLQRQLGEHAAFNSDYEKIVMLDADDKVTKSLHLKPGDAKDFRVRINGLSQPGTYSAKLSIPAADRSPTSVNISFKLRRAGRVAAFWIAVGVVTSFLLRLWGTQLRPRMQELHKLTGVLQSISKVEQSLETRRPEEQEVLERMRELIREQYEAVRIGTENSAEPVIANTKKKLPLLSQWINLNRLVLDLRPEPQAAPFRKKLATVRAVLLAAEPSAEAFTAAKSTLQALPEELKTKLKELVKEFKEQTDILSLSLDDQFLRKWKANVTERIENLDITNIGVDSQAIDDANQAIEEARLESAKILAEDLTAKLSADNVTPEWMETGQFQKLQARLRAAQAATDADTAVGEFHEALQLYLDPFARELLSRIAPLLPDFKKKHEDLSDADDEEATKTKLELQGYITKLTADQAKLKQVPSLLETGKFGEAALICRNVAKELAEFTAAGLMDKDATPATATPAGAVPQITLPILGFLLPQTDAELAETRQALWSRLTLLDWIFQAVVMAISVALGLYVLWANNLTWGTPGDVLVAILWGLGLHALTTNTGSFTGVSDLAARFRA